MGETGDVLASLVRIEYAANVLGTQLVLLADFQIAVRSIDEENALVCHSILLEHHYDGGDAGAVEDVGGNTDDRRDMAPVEQVASNRLLLAAAEEHAVRQDDTHNAAGHHVIERMLEEGVVRLGFRRDPVGEAAVYLLGRQPLLGVGRIETAGVHA